MRQASVRLCRRSWGAPYIRLDSRSLTPAARQVLSDLPLLLPFFSSRSPPVLWWVIDPQSNSSGPNGKSESYRAPEVKDSRRTSGGKLNCHTSLNLRQIGVYLLLYSYFLNLETS